MEPHTSVGSAGTVDDVAQDGTGVASQVFCGDGDGIELGNRGIKLQHSRQDYPSEYSGSDRETMVRIRMRQRKGGGVQLP